MALSPNYGWSEPDNASLVKDGAQAMRTLGDAIDTSVWNIGYGQAGKNKIINGDFQVWQRGTSFTANAAYAADRWIPVWDGSGATKTISQQTFTPGAAPVAGYESQYFLRFAQSVAGTGGTYNVINQRIEDVRTFAGQPVTISFWAKASSSVSMATAPSLNQNFGSGGSATIYPGFTGTAPALTTSWQRFNYTTTVPSVSGKTIGTSSYLEIGLNMPLNTTFTIDIWGVQLEYGSKATPFETATGTIQGELAACQRYYERRTATDAFNTFAAGAGQSTTAAWINVNTKVTLRSAPASIEFSTLAIADGTNAAIAVTGLVVQGTTNGTNSFNLVATVAASGVQYRPYYLLANNSSSAYVAWSSEL